MCKYINNFGDRQLEEIFQYIDRTAELYIMYFTGLDRRVGRRRMDVWKRRYIGMFAETHIYIFKVTRVWFQQVCEVHPVPPWGGAPPQESRQTT
jgi:hypothetical protein